MKKVGIQAIEQQELERLLQALPECNQHIRCQNCKKELRLDEIAAVRFVDNQVSCICNDVICQEQVLQKGTHNGIQ